MIMQRLQCTASFRVLLALDNWLSKQGYIDYAANWYTSIKKLNHKIHTIYTKWCPPLSVLGLRVAYLCNLILLLPWVFQTLQTRKM